jgi:ABC-type multidrug transport system fused ATPase/permease subunit
MIDGKDIAKMSLDDLRTAITIILQDPCLIAGTLRDVI